MKDDTQLPLSEHDQEDLRFIAEGMMERDPMKILSGVAGTPKGMTAGLACDILRKFADPLVPPEHWNLYANLRMAVLCLVIHDTSGQAVSESKVQEDLFEQLGGRREVKCPAGRVDLLTDTEVIEVKNWEKWKSGLAQVLRYLPHFPGRTARLHLFSKKGEPFDSSVIAAESAKLGVKITSAH